MKIKMAPHVTRLGNGAGGIARVVEAYFKYLPDYDVELVARDADSYDLKAAHAGMTDGDCDICHCHGLYWTADYDARKWEYDTNAKVINAARNAKAITVPSHWVAETFQRDMRVSPAVVPHGIDWQDWQHTEPNGGYVLYNKNRQGDVCDATPLEQLAELFPQQRFMTTFTTTVDHTPNIKRTGVVLPSKMKKMVQGANIYLATTKETFGIGILEAMASGVPVLGYNHGGICDIVQHGVNGFLAEPGNMENLAQGLAYCLKYRNTLGQNGREMAKRWGWASVCEQIANIYRAALTEQEPTVAIVIPSYNYGHKVHKAIASACAQTYEHLTDIIIVDDGSNDRGKTEKVVREWMEKDSRIRYARQANQGVAVARNTGIAAVNTKYVCCLDADDQIKPGFIASLIPDLEADRTLGIGYSALVLLGLNGKKFNTKWPNEFDYDLQVKGQNRVPTCCVFRKDAWERTGGYRQRYAPGGCGTEDAEFWLRIGSIGYGGKKVTEDRLFIYNAGGYTTGTKGYKEVNWLQWHPWTSDGDHPFASQATPAYKSHRVRQYDDPLISVVIPVGPGHETRIIEALDSLEAQSMRKWEAIIADDTCTLDVYNFIKKAYPYVKWIPTFAVAFDEAGNMTIPEGEEPKGAGKARNMGAREARAPFLLFLDADDWLVPLAMETMLLNYSSLGYEAIIYSESFGVRAVDQATADQYQMRNELISYDRGIATVRQPITEYDYNLATRQPYTPTPYFWCYISSLIPTKWHREVGGFDEELPAWEDWDYWIRLAKSGKPFIGIEQPLMTYSYDAGARREEGKKIKSELLNFMGEKHKDMTIKGCRHCDNKRKPRMRPSRQNLPQPIEQQRSAMTDKDFVMIRYTRPKRGDHPLTGVTVFQSQIEGIKMRKSGAGWVIDYGYRNEGQTFLVHVRDQRAQPTWFTIIEAPQAQRVVKLPERKAAVPASPPKPVWQEQQPPVIQETVLPEAVTMPEPEILGDTAYGQDPVLEKIRAEVGDPAPPFDLQGLPGISPQVAAAMEDAGLVTPKGIQEAGIEGLVAIKGIGESKASAILATVNELEEAEKLPDIMEEMAHLLGE